MNSDDKEYTLTRDRFIRGLGIPTRAHPDMPLKELYGVVMSKQQELTHEEQRRRGDLFSSTMEEYISQWSFEYFTTAGYACDVRLYELLRTCRMNHGAITVTNYLSNGKKKVRAFTEDTAPKLFAEFEVPYHAGAVHDLLEKIKDLQAKCLEVQWQEALEKLRASGEKGTAASKWLEANWGRFSFWDGHLVFQPSIFEACGANAMISRFRKDFGLTPSQSKPVFRVLADRLNSQEKLLKSPEEASLSEATTKECIAVYSNARNAWGVHINMDEDKLQLKKITDAPSHSLKTLPASKGAVLSQGVEDLLAAIAGGNIDAADDLAKLFADVADPRSEQPRLAVVYTKQNVEIIQRLLHEVFHKKTSSTPVSVNKTLSKNGKLELLNQQIRGELLVLLNDTMPSDTYLSDFAATRKGKNLTVEDSILGKQTFKNHLHFVYVTDRSGIVSNLSKQYGAAVVDLSAWERPYEANGGTLLTAEERDWFRSAFILHGCAVKYLRRGRKAKKSRSDVALQDVTAFFKTCCKISRKAVCERNELYEAYCEYYQRIHNCQPPESDVIFNRYMKQICPPSVEYKVRRYGEDKATHLCYVGLKLLPQEGQWDSGQEDNSELFHGYLERMGQAADTLLTQIEMIKVQVSN